MTLEDLAALGLFKNDQTGDTGSGARVLRRATARLGGYDRPVFETHGIRFQLAEQPADECYSSPSCAGRPARWRRGGRW